MLSRLVFYAMVTLAGTIGALGDILLNQWAKKGGSFWWVVGGYVGWNIALTIFLYMLKKQYLLSFSGASFAAANGLVLMIACWKIFHEDISNLSWFGLVLIFSGIVIAEIGR